MMVLGTHIFGLQTFFFGAPESAWAEVLIDGRPVCTGELTETVEPIGPTAGDEIFAAFRFPNSVRALFESRRGLADPGRQRAQMGIAIMGTEGTLSLRFDDNRDATVPMRSAEEAHEVLQRQKTLGKVVLTLDA